MNCKPLARLYLVISLAIILLFNILACIRNDVNYPVTMNIEDEYILVIDTPFSSSYVKSSGCFGEDPCFIDLVDTVNHLYLSFYFGNKNPPEYWKASFDFELSRDSIKKVIAEMPDLRLIMVRERLLNGLHVKSIMYEKDMMIFKVDSQYEDNNGVLWNVDIVVVPEYIKKKKFWKVHDRFIKNISVTKI